MMTDRYADAPEGSETRVVYTCWPCVPGGFTLCGLILIVAGGAILADILFPGSSEAIWGIALLLVGGWALSRARREGEPW